MGAQLFRIWKAVRASADRGNASYLEYYGHQQIKMQSIHPTTSSLRSSAVS